MNKTENENTEKILNTENSLFLKNAIVKLVIIGYDNQMDKIISELSNKYDKSLILRRKKDKINFNLEEYFSMSRIEIREIIMKKLTQKSFIKEFKHLKMEFLREHISLLLRNLITMLLYMEIKTGEIDAFIYVGNLERLENEELAEFLLYL